MKVIILLYRLYLFSFLIIINGNYCDSLTRNNFPKHFLFGVSTSAYQIEGGQLNGKGETIWDFYSKIIPEYIHNASNGFIAADSYNKWSEDVDLIDNLQVDFYRFSLSWSRILPTGLVNEINTDGIRYYNNLINRLKLKNIEPMITIYHWDMPKNLQDLGGWTNSLIQNYFEEYANIVFENFGDRVKFWITMNVVCHGYGDDSFPPFIKIKFAKYLCIHNILSSHAKVYNLYKKKFKKRQNGKIGITIDGRWLEPASHLPDDIEAAERVRQVEIGIMAHPIFLGDYPDIVKDLIRDKVSNFQLPSFGNDSKIKGSIDFLGLNIYTSFLVKNINKFESKIFQNESWPKSQSTWLRVVPSTIRNVLKWINNRYQPGEIFITENGFSDNGTLKDFDRINYHKKYLASLLEAVLEDKIPVKGYAIWSLLDNLEWIAGYSEKFGLYQVDFNDINRTRTPKLSAFWYRKFLNRSKPSDEL